MHFGCLTRCLLGSSADNLCRQFGPKPGQAKCQPLSGSKLSDSPKYFTDRSKAVIFCGSFMFLFCLVFAMSLCASVYMCFVVTCWERADLLALVCGVYCEFVTFPLVSWVRCGTWLYRFLIFAPFLTLLYFSNDIPERIFRKSWF